MPKRSKDFQMWRGFASTVVKEIQGGTTRAKDLPEMEEHLLGMVGGLDETEAVLKGCYEALHDGPAGGAAVGGIAVGQTVLHLHRHRHQLLGSLYLRTETYCHE